METIKKTAKGFGNQEKLYQRLGRASLPFLVRQAKARMPISYSDLARQLNMANPRTLNYPLGAVSHEMKKLGGKWGRPIPAINCIVLNKNNGLPGEGIGAVEDRGLFKKLSYRDQKRRVDRLLDEIYGFGGWNDVLAEYELEPLSVTSEKKLRDVSREAVRRAKSGGERDLHRRLKESLARRPDLFNLPNNIVGELEFPFPSADRIDILFKNGAEWVGVEVKGLVSDENDHLRGIFQCVKYQALIEAEQKLLQNGVNCRVILATAKALSPDIELQRDLLGIRSLLVET